jgi:formylglycine-generating enzyme required for sulfatase activity
MQETDVTEEQYSAVTGKNLSTFQTGDSAILCPVDSIRWYDAVLFCNALSKMSDLDTCYNYSQSGATDAVCNFTKNGYRLPTEAQWEYACRAGSTTLYWWGSDTNGMGARVWWYKNSNNRIHPVAKKVANAWGLYDMMGDVWQWCNDWYGAYTAGPVTDPTGAASGTNRIFRGGSWSDDGLGFYISASRNGAVPSYCDNHHGFRVVLPR